MASDLWSLGLSLVEMSLGMYPIPPPDPATLSAIFGTPLSNEDVGGAVRTPRTPRSPGNVRYTEYYNFGPLQMVQTKSGWEKHILFRFK